MKNKIGFVNIKNKMGIWLNIAMLVFAPVVAVSNGFQQPGRGQGVVKIPVGSGQLLDLYAKSYALVIGCIAYTDWPVLGSVKQDVDEISQVLGEHGFAITKVLNPTRTQLDQAIRDFINDYGQEKQNRLLIWFAGHGHTINTVGGLQGYIVPVDAPLPTRGDAIFKRAAISMDQIDTYVRSVEAKHLLWLFDSCFSGSLFEATRSAPPAIEERTSRPVRQFITAGTASQTVPAKSLFREQFVAGLRGEADFNKDSFITGDELGQFLFNTVTNYSRRAQTPEYGKIRNPLLDKGDFVFALRQKPIEIDTEPLKDTSGEKAYWDVIKESTDPKDFEEYLRNYKSGIYVNAAQAKIRRLAATMRTDNPSPVVSNPPGNNSRPNPPEEKKPEAPRTTPANATKPSAAEIAEYNRKVEETRKQNAKIEEDNKAMTLALETGRTALNNKDYTAAIAEFDKGLAIDAEQNVFWYLKGLSLYNRGVTKLNSSINPENPSQTGTLRDGAKADFMEAITQATKAVALLEAQEAADPTKATQNKPTKAGYLKVKADAASLLGRRFSDQTMAESANKDYIAVAALTDNQMQKRRILFLGAETLREAGNVEAAIIAYKAIIDFDPDYADAYYGMGLAYFGNEKTFQEGANYLQFFINKAPANDPRVAEAKGVLASLNVKASPEALRMLDKSKATPSRKRN